MKKIKFLKSTEHSGVTGHSPSPSKKNIPEWYKKMHKYMGKGLTLDGSGNPNLTIKACPPFLDSMMSGYMICTESDLYVSWNDGEPWIEWKALVNLVSTHEKEQIVSNQVPDGFSDQPMKFNNLWQIVTPKGYSTMFTHPQNRTDLPFYTISGIVETDTYKSVINFPFFIKKDFEGIIPAGTPIVQLHPFKRESWKMELGQADQKEIFESQVKLNQKIIGGYKSQWWRRKEYS